jgi:predicted kinase
VTDRSPAFVAELCGLPGVGKTYLASHVRDRCRALGVRLSIADAMVGAARPMTRRVPRKALLVATEMLSHPVTSARAVGSIQRSRQRRQRDVVSWCVQWLVAQRLLAGARRTGGAHLLDEGPLQALWSIGLRGDVTGLLRAENDRPFARDVPDLLVVVDAPLETIARRLAARGSRHSRIQQLARSQLCAELATGKELLESLVAWRQSSGGDRVQVAYIRNLDHDSTDQEIQRIAEVVAGRAGVRNRHGWVALPGDDWPAAHR